MNRVRAFTLVELLVVMAIIGILMALALPTMGRSLRRADQVQCLNNLRQIGLSLQQFADDHRNRYPMQVPAAEGGAQEATIAATGRVGYFVNAVENFVAIERELVTPKLLVCRSDQRTVAESFQVLHAGQVSYLLASNALPGSPISVLAVDRNLGLAPTGSGLPETNAALVFDATMHEHRGNVLLADGRVEWLRGLSQPSASGAAPAGPGTPEPPTNEPTGDGETNALPAAPSPIVTTSTSRTPRQNLPLGAAVSPSGKLTTNAPVSMAEVAVDQTAMPTPIAFIPVRPLNDPARNQWWWLWLVILALIAWWYWRRRSGGGTDAASRGAPAGMVLQNAVATAGTLAQTAGVKRFFSGAAINADLLVTMLGKHGINARQEFARELLREHEDEFSRETIVFVPDEEFDRAYQLFYAERQDEL